MNQMMESIFMGTGQGAVTVGSFLICMGVSVFLGMIIAGVYMFRNTYTKSFVITLVVLPAIIQVIIMLVNGNLGAGIAVMGAFSLIRFRSAQGTAREIGSIFLAMAAGLAMGMGYIGVAVLFTLVLSGVSMLLEFLKFGERRKPALLLRITIPESLDYTEVFDEVFQNYTASWKLQQVKTTNMGSLFKLEYRIILKKQHTEKEMMDELRCRNGNLEVLCSYGETNPECQVL
ncbi:MAG: DUF4956 domain-containing protein [Bacteroides sp.]|nr:DUF4956 domain-containing protein [Bacteroides sp.]MCM1550748.1 DUF4956 domain-containing protein [Clostridium sp.]